MYWVAHFDESDHMDGTVLGFGGLIVRGDKLPALSAGWQRLRGSLGVKGEVCYGGLSHVGRERVVRFVVRHDPHVLVDVMVDARRMNGRTARDHYRVALAWCLGRMALLATEPSVRGMHQVIVDRPPKLRPLDRSHRADSRLAWAEGQTSTYAFKEYATCWANGNARMRVPKLRLRGFQPGLLASDATYNPLLELPDVVMGCVVRWVCNVMRKRTDAKLAALVKRLAPLMVFPGGEMGLDIFCPNWERSPYWGARNEALGRIRDWMVPS